MQIKDFISGNLRYDTTSIAADPELSQEIQTILIDQGLLSPPIDSPFGDRATAALTRFQLREGCNEPEFLGPETAAKLAEVAALGTRAPVALITLEALETTVLKLRPLASDALADTEKKTLHAGKKLDLTFFQTERKHVQIVLNEAMDGSNVWYVFADHVKIYGGEAPALPEIPDEKPPISQPPQSGEVKLPVPYKSQLDNGLNPEGSCNVTCIAMCLEYFKIPRKKTSGQFEDELYQYALDNNLSRHSPHDLAVIAQDYGAKDAFDSHATVDAVKAWLSAGNPAVTHGYFTGSGHIIVLVGYDEKGFIVHDPNGEWYSTGYDRNLPTSTNAAGREKGKFQHYSYNLIQKTCAYDGEFWVHFISNL